MIKISIKSFLPIVLLVNTELQFADNFVSVEEVDEYVVVLLKHAILYFHDAQKVAVEFLNLVKQAQNCHKFVFFACVSRTHEVTHLKCHQIDLSQIFQITQCSILIVLQILIVFIKTLSCADGKRKKSVHQTIEVVEGMAGHQFLQFSCKNVNICEPADKLPFYVLTRKHALQYFTLVLKSLKVFVNSSFLPYSLFVKIFLLLY